MLSKLKLQQLWNESMSMFVVCDSVAYLGEGVFCDVLVGDVKGLDQLAGDLGVCRVSGLPIGACKKKKNS